MKVGTPGFQGERLRQARVAIGLTQASLALLIGVKSTQVISGFESGEATPAPEVFNRIVAVTRQPVHFFLTPVPLDLRPSPIIFRSMRSLDEVAKASAEMHLLWLAEYVRYVKEYVELPSLNIPNFSDIPEDPLLITDEHIREAAKRLREFWDLGTAPLPDIVNLLEANGFIILLQEFDSPKWDAVSFWDEETRTPIIILNKDKPSYFRLRFNLLHELFHLLFHRKVDEELCKAKNYASYIERQAHLFAGEMGLPKAAFLKDVYATNLDALRVIKLKWGFSIGAMIHRLSDLGVLNERESTNLWKNYGRRKWRTEEPWDMDKRYPPEKPTILHNSIGAIFEHKAQSLEDIRANGLFSEDIQELCTEMGEEFWRSPTPDLKVYKLFG